MTSNVPVWEKIKADVLTRIHTRQWPPGSLIPNEADFAAELGVARATVNRALQALADDGILERRRKAGTRVAETPVRQARMSIPIVREEIEATGAIYGYSLIAIKQALVSGQRAVQLGVPNKSKVLHLEALFLADGRPYMLESRWINMLVLPNLDVEVFQSMSANEWLVKNAPFTNGDVSFLAELPTHKDVEFLGLKGNDPLLISERLTRSGEQVITWVRMAYAPGHVVKSAI